MSEPVASNAFQRERGGVAPLPVVVVMVLIGPVVGVVIMGVIVQIQRIRVLIVIGVIQDRMAVATVVVDQEVVLDQALVMLVLVIGAQRGKCLIY